MKPHMCWISGAKGGIGKSIVSMALVDCLSRVISIASRPQIHWSCT